MLRSPARLAALLALVLGTGLLLALYNPVGNNPDELSHLQRAQYRQAFGSMPDPYSVLKVQQDKHPPYVYVLGSVVLSLTDHWWSDPDAAWRLPGPWERRWHPGRPLASSRDGDLDLRLLLQLREDGVVDEAGRPLKPLDPGFTRLRNQVQALQAGAPAAADASPEARRLYAALAGQEPRFLIREGQVLVLRLVMVLHWGLLAFGLLALCDLVWPDRPRFAFALAWAGAAIPQAALTGASFSPDGPLTAFCALAFVHLACWSLGLRGDLRQALLAGVWLGLALLCKAAAFCLLPAVLVGLVLRSRVQVEGGSRLRQALRGSWPLAVLPLAIAGFWYLGNLLSHHDLFGWRANYETFTHAARRSPTTAAFCEVFVEDLWRTFFGFWHREILLPRPLFYLWAALGGVAATGLLLLLSPRVRLSETEAPQRRVALLAGVVAATMLFLTWRGVLAFDSVQGRYLYPALAPMTLLFGLGLRVGARLHRDGRAWYAAGTAAWLVLVWGFGYAILDHECVDRGRAAGHGGVLCYVDCGGPGAAATRVQGYRAPDPGELGRDTPWRSLDGHPVAVIHRLPIPADHRGRRLQLRVTYCNPDPSAPYVAEEQGRFVYVAQRLFANDAQVHDHIEVTSTPEEYVFPLPEAVTSAEALELRFVRLQGIAACVSEIWLEEPWPDSGGEAMRVRGPWRRFEAEAWPAPGRRWFGDPEASGCYLLRGKGLLARFPALPAPEGGRELRMRYAVLPEDWRPNVPTEVALTLDGGPTDPVGGRGVAWHWEVGEDIPVDTGEVPLCLDYVLELRRF
ncbi:MAG: DUF2142 domain-containing protein [Planctomycetota bacterium]